MHSENPPKKHKLSTQSYTIWEMLAFYIFAGRKIYFVMQIYIQKGHLQNNDQKEKRQQDKQYSTKHLHRKLKIEQHESH
jgi:hypothetical protein